MRKLHAILLSALILLAGCKGTGSVYEQAKTPDDYARAVLSHHNALGVAALAMREDPSVSPVTKDRIRTIYRKTVCSSAELDAGSTTEACRNGPSYKLEQAGRAVEALRTAQTEAELYNVADELTALLVDLTNLVGVKK